MLRIAATAALAVLLLASGIAPAAAQTRPAPSENRALLDMLSQIEGLSRQMRELRGEIEETANKAEVATDRLQKGEKRQSDLYNDTDARLRRFEQQAKDDADAKRKLVAQLGELDARLKKLETAVLAFAGTAQLAEVDARVRKLETATATAASTSQLTELDQRLRKLESVAAAATTIPAPVVPAPVAPTAPPAAPIREPAASPVAPPPAPPPPASPPPAATPAAGPPPVAAPAPLPGAPNPTDPDAVRRVYEQALSRQRTGDSAGAVQEFRSFLKLYPRHELAPNAQYWLGEAYFRLADYPNAIAAQQKLLVTYPDHLKAPDAMLILGNALGAQGETSAARKTFEDLIARYPSNEAAEKARQRLSKLK